MQKTPVGHRVRDQRQRLGLTQTALAARVGISPSYLNLIEHNRRSIGGALLRRVAEALELDVQSLSGAEEARLTADLAEVLADPVLAEIPLDAGHAEKLAGSPETARAVLALYRAYRDAREQVETLCERVSTDPFLAQVSHQILTLITSIRSIAEIMRDYGDLSDEQRQRFNATLAEESQALTRLTAEMFDFIGGRGAHNPAPSPAEEVDDVFYDHDGHFPAIEEAANRARIGLDPDRTTLYAALLDHLDRRHGVSVVFRPAGELLPRGHRYDGELRRLELSEASPDASARFQLARLLARLEAGTLIEEAVADPRLTTAESRERCRSALCSYFAGALLFPYERFL
ncbi:MAG: helix-turn-helix domain-containing protein, partial [Ectothiorhodospiraceae bacterium]